MQDQTRPAGVDCLTCKRPMEVRETFVAGVLIGQFISCPHCGRLLSAWAGNVRKAKEALGLQDAE